MNYFSTLQNKAAQSIVLASLLLIGATGNVQADSTSKEGAQSLATYDTNNDGTISLEEATAHKMPIQVFKELDTNHDGKLSSDESAKENQHMK